jgi:hypothetical protein
MRSPRVAIRAGSSAASVDSAIATAVEKPAVRHPIDVSSASCSLDVVMNATSAPPTHDAASSPMAEPQAVRTSASVSSCRNTRARFAPIARRTAISRRRAVPRASSRLATLAHATASSSVARPISSETGSANALRTRENPARPGSSAVFRAR